MARDKKGKSDGKKAKIAEKKHKQAKKGAKKKIDKNLKGNDSDAEDIDLEAVLASYAKEQEKFLKVTEVTCEPPKPRASATLIASPTNSNELFLFGGEYFNGALAAFYNDLYVYLIKKDEWRSINSPNTPLPRSGHAWCRGAKFWRFDPSTREWTRLEVKGKSPPARSGHRMTYHKNYIILFGGFQDSSQNTKYLADLWIFDTQTYSWFTPELPVSTPNPDARSSFTFLPHDEGAVLYGGYSRAKVAITGRQTKGTGQSQRSTYKPLVHQDCFFLRITPAGVNSTSNPYPKVRWERRKKPINLPNPSRAGATMTYHKGRGILFGGVHDTEENEERIESEFFNGLFAWNIERNRFFQLNLRKPKSKQDKIPEEGRSGRRGRVKANEEDLLKNLAILEIKRALSKDDKENEIEESGDKEETMEIFHEKLVSQEFPHERFNAQLTTQDDILYIYGGTYERGDREFTFDDMYAIDLGKLDCVKQIFRREAENWYGSDIEEEDEEDDEEDDEEEDEEEEIENEKKIKSKCQDEEIPVNIPDCTVQQHLQKKYKIESKKPDKLQATESENVSPLPVSNFDDLTNDIITMAHDDHFPHPRPFESRRDFFQRTSHLWQEILITSLRWKGILPETLSVKEIKTKAFEKSENHWWESREEIMILEDEQEAAGIGEIVTLSDKKDSSGVFKKR
ncbi:Kelch repeat-containing protein 3 [Golovinomyces cichoracearum]|uniref:Kelch repeat-containing protein 3 n=1 Tax=Golovinomyces cichoracearum TaxID=62708 RepID=A0A420HVS3_9PEZI|nr:Kelch repeat-containing protein 3 [Golovinomyces cichoracearum]